MLSDGKTSSLVAEAVPCYTACGSERIVKNGKNARGHQQFCCRACGACRVRHPKRRETAPSRQAEVLRAVATERLSLRAAERVFGVGRHTSSRYEHMHDLALRLFIHEYN